LAGGPEKMIFNIGSGFGALVSVGWDKTAVVLVEDGIACPLGHASAKNSAKNTEVFKFIGV